MAITRTVASLDLYLIVGVAIAICGGCTGRNSSTVQRFPSLDGKRVVEATINSNRDDPTTYLCVHLRIIRDPQGAAVVELDTQTGASHRMRWDVDWESDRQVLLKSSDIGERRWTRGDDESWHAVDHLKGT
jgi:hypothetical protein